MPNVILVNEQDEPIGEMEKLEAHQKGLLHRAFSVLLYRKTASGIEVLLQQRALSKYHCGGLWANTCCSHPLPGESNSDAANRRLQEEVGVSADLTYAGSFIYKAELDNGLIEHEYDHVFLGEFDGDITLFNPDEIAQMRWVALTSKKEFSDFAGECDVAPWLEQVLNLSFP